MTTQDNAQANGTDTAFAAYTKFTQMGRVESAKVGGDPKQLQQYLFMFYDQDNVTATLWHDIKRLTDENERYEKEISHFTELTKSLAEKRRTTEEERDRLLSEQQNEIGTKRSEIRRIRGGDYSLLGAQADPANKPGFFIAIVILVLLTAYLINFYASVIYNAFLFDPLALIEQTGDGEALQVGVNIVNLHAFDYTFRDYGWVGVLFLLSGSFIFIALGFLLHWFTVKQWFWGLVAVYAFTFILDGFLAYEVVHKIDLAEQIAGLSEEGEVWYFTKAFQEPAFYIILLAGFGMYVAWGLLFRYILEEYGKILPEMTGIRKLRAEIRRLQHDMREVGTRMNTRIRQLAHEAEAIQQKEINFRQSSIHRNREAIKGLRSKIRGQGQSLKISMQELRTQITFFVTGWLSEVRQTQNGLADEQIRTCHSMVDQFYKTIGYN